MEQIEKLKNLQRQSKVQTSNLKMFDGLPVVYLGVEPKQYFPKIKDNFGNNIKDIDGKDKRAEESSGFIYTFSEFQTSKVVKIVLENKLNLSLLKAYYVAGFGYDINKANLIFIERDGKISDL